MTKNVNIFSGGNIDPMQSIRRLSLLNRKDKFQDLIDQQILNIPIPIEDN